MTKAYRSSKVLKFIDCLRDLRKKESENAIIFGNHLKEEFLELCEKKELNDKEDIYEAVLERMVEHSYKENGISFSHLQFSFFYSAMFHVGSVSIIDTIIKEMVDFFDLSMPERGKANQDKEKYNIKALDTLDYSNFQREFVLVIGGMGEGYSNEVQEKCTQLCLKVLFRFIDQSDIKKIEKGFIIKTSLQMIPDLMKEFTKNNIAVYGIIPVNV